MNSGQFLKAIETRNSLCNNSEFSLKSTRNMIDDLMEFLRSCQNQMTSSQSAWLKLLEKLYELVMVDGFWRKSTTYVSIILFHVVAAYVQRNYNLFQDKRPKALFDYFHECCKTLRFDLCVKKREEDTSVECSKEKPVVELFEKLSDAVAVFIDEASKKLQLSETQPDASKSVNWQLAEFLCRVVNECKLFPEDSENAEHANTESSSDKEAPSKAKGLGSEDQPFADQQVANRQVANRPVVNRPFANRQVSNRPVVNRPVANRSNWQVQGNLSTVEQTCAVDRRWSQINKGTDRFAVKECSALYTLRTEERMQSVDQTGQEVPITPNNYGTQRYRRKWHAKQLPNLKSPEDIYYS